MVTKRKRPDGLTFPRLSPKEALILQLLISGARYGLDMVKQSDGELTRGGVYVQLDRMEEKGYVKSKIEEQPRGETGPARRVYTLTGLGQRALAAHEAARAAFAGFVPGGAR